MVPPAPHLRTSANTARLLGAGAEAACHYPCRGGELQLQAAWAQGDGYDGDDNSKCLRAALTVYRALFLVLYPYLLVSGSPPSQVGTVFIILFQR